MAVPEGLGWDEGGFASMPLFSTAGRASCNSPRNEQPGGWDVEACNELNKQTEQFSASHLPCPWVQRRAPSVTSTETLQSTHPPDRSQQPVPQHCSPPVEGVSTLSCCARVPYQLLRPAAASHCCVHRGGHGNLPRNQRKKC